MAHPARTPTPNSMIVLSGNNEDSEYKPKRISSGKKHKLKREGSTTSLEILPPEEKENDKTRGSIKASKKSSRPSSGRPDSGTGSRPGSSATRAPPIRDSPSRRPGTPGTPTRQVSLQTVKRKEEKELDLGPLDWKPSTDGPDPHLPGQVDRLTLGEPSTGAKYSDNPAKGASANVSDSDEYDTDLEDGDGGGDEEEEEEEPSKAPNELFMEFLDTVFKKEWNVAKNLCKMILLFEPDHVEANKFAPLIEEKLRLDAEPSTDDDSGDDSDDSDSDGDSDDSGDDNSSSQDSSDEEYNPEDEEEVTEGSKKDSGIGLSSSSGGNPT